MHKSKQKFCAVVVLLLSNHIQWPLESRDQINVIVPWEPAFIIPEHSLIGSQE